MANIVAKRGIYTKQRPTSYAQGLYEVSSTQKLPIGLVRELDDGRRFVYCSNTAAAIAAAAGGVLISRDQAPIDGTVAAADVTFGGAVGSIDVTVTAAGLTANSHKGGWLVLKAGAGVGQGYKIVGNTATDNPATGRAKLQLERPVNTLWVAANTTVAIYPNPYSSLLLNPAVANEAATTQERVMGMVVQPIAASSFFWAQTWGIASLVLDVAAAAGAEANEMNIVPGPTAGRGALIADTAYAGGVQIIGHTLESADLTTAEGNLVFLTIS